MLASLAVVVAALYLAKGVLVPLTLALLLSFLLSPVCDWLERHRLGRIPAVLVTVVLGFTLLGLATWTTVVQMAELAPRMPEYQSNLQAKFHSANVYLGVALSKVTSTAQDMDQSLPAAVSNDELRIGHAEPLAVRVVPSPASPLQVLGGVYATLLGVLGSTAVVFLLVVFFLIRRDDLRDRFIRLMGQDQVTGTTDALSDAGTRVSRYLATQFVINVTFGVPVAVGLYLIGVPNAVLWGILATVLRFIPYIGPWIAAVMPIALSLAISNNWVAPILTVVLFVMLELVFNNVIEPWLYGKRTGISPVAVLVAAVFWTWLWGGPGLLLATPMTVCLLVVGKHVPQLAFLNILLGDEAVFEPGTHVYQRLLAGDQEEATELVETHLAGNSLAQTYDALLIPTLGFAEHDRHRGAIDEDRKQFIFESVQDTIEELGDRHKDALTPRAPEDQHAPRDDSSGDLPSNGDVAVETPKPCLLCLPARKKTDEIAVTMLAQLAEMNGFRVETVSLAALPGEIVELVTQQQADVVCISAMPPAATRHARGWCKRLQNRFPDARIVVGLWNAKGDIEKLRTRIGCSASVRVVVTLAQAQEQILLALPSPLQCEQPRPSDAVPSLSPQSMRPGSIVRIPPGPAAVV